MKRFHRAWAVCLGCMLMLLVSGGLCINVFSVTQPYILAQNGFTNTQTSMITTVRSVAYLLFLSIAPAFFRKTGYRWGLTLAVILAAVSFVLFANVLRFWLDDPGDDPHDALVPFSPGHGHRLLRGWNGRVRRRVFTDPLAHHRAVQSSHVLFL